MGPMKSFQLVTKVKITRVAMDGPIWGRTIFRYTPYSLRPSMRAASRSSLGMPMQNWRRRNTPKASKAWSRISEAWVSTRPNLFIMVYWGSIYTCQGTAMVAT